MSEIGLGLGQAQLYAMILGLDTGDDTWATAGMPAFGGDYSEAYNGGARNPILYPGRDRYENMTLSRPYMYDRDFAAHARLEDIKRRHQVLTVTFFFEQDDGVRGTVSYLAMIQRIIPPAGNADATDRTELGVELRVLSKVGA